MPPVATAGDSGKLSLYVAGGYIGIGGGGGVHQSRYLILSRFLSWDARARTCLGRIGTVTRCCVKPRLVSGEGVTLKHCGLETHGSWKWDTPPPEEAFLIPGRGDRIFINLFFKVCIIVLYRGYFRMYQED